MSSASFIPFPVSTSEHDGTEGSKPVKNNRREHKSRTTQPQKTAFRRKFENTFFVSNRNHYCFERFCANQFSSAHRDRADGAHSDVPGYGNQPQRAGRQL